MFSVPGRAGREVECSAVRGEDVNVTDCIEWLRAKLSFEVLRSALLALCEGQRRLGIRRLR